MFFHSKPGQSQPSAALPPSPPILWQQHLSLLLESTGSGVFGVDNFGNCNYINTAGAQMIGLPPHQILGRNMHVLTHHSHANGRPYSDNECPIFNAFRRAQPCRIDTEVFWRADGRAFPVEYTSHPIMDRGVLRGAVVTFVDITERREAALALQRTNEELEARVTQRTLDLSEALRQQRELAAHLERVREEERTRIAREIHDELGSLLVALKMELRWMEKRLSEQAERSVDDAQCMRLRMQEKCATMGLHIDEAVHNVERIITDLRPSILDHQGLWAALEWQARTLVESTEMDLQWSAYISPDAQPPEDDQAVAVFRIFQEMLSNVARHAHASRIHIALQATQVQLHLRVCDDGRGAHPQVFQAPNAYGVRGMHERARHMGGSLMLETELGKGTCCALVVPLKHCTHTAGPAGQPKGRIA
ncbi:PAS domain-containing protein [Lampropedia puyangensis]|uniref:PAS domain-containing protein n=1 Tax=Lampropedia puyangensis TaxID=1330072 RepID=A0A4S8F6L1_9BURK|nr:PAS domain-containing protein [Lampropedia puyangensis]THU01002.1 PAS domain-containing protein [Lampropedia puyangensis]